MLSYEAGRNLDRKTGVAGLIWPYVGAEYPVALFLALVFALSVSSKRGSQWPSELAGYGLWPPKWSVRLATVVRWIEAIVAFSLVALAPIGLLLAGAVFLAYGIVLAQAVRLGYQGSCGCSRHSGPVSRSKMARAFLWGSLAAGLGIGHYEPSMTVLGVCLVVLVASETAVLLGPSLLLRGFQRSGVRPQSDATGRA